MLEALDWLRDNQALLWWLLALSVGVFLATLAVIPLIVVRMEPDYFMRRSPSPDSWRGQHRAVRVTLRVLKNLAGLLFVLAGLAMVVLPGPGIITILIGIGLLEFPGKRQLELSIVRQRAVLGAINWMRKRAGRVPLQLPERRNGTQESAT